MDGLAMKPKGPRATEQRAREWAARSTDPPLPDWLQIRDYQLDAVERVVKEYEAGARVVFLDAPTGTGKTAIAEMVRRRLEVARGLYVCTTKSLQDQVARDFPYARVLKGRANYTPTKLSARERDGYRQGARGMDSLRVTCGDCDAGPVGVEAEDQTCSYCYAVEECPYKTARRQAEVAPVGVLNTSFLLSHLNAGINATKSEFARRELVVADECDLLEDELLGYVEMRLSARVLDQMGLEVPKKGSHMTTIRKWRRRSGRGWTASRARRLGTRWSNAGPGGGWSSWLWRSRGSSTARTAGSGMGTRRGTGRGWVWCSSRCRWRTWATGTCGGTGSGGCA
jgi:hypothetical protein